MSAVAALRPVAVRRPSGRTVLTGLLALAVLWSVLLLDVSAGVVHAGGWSTLAEILSSALTPELSASFVATVVGDLWTTVAFALAGMSVAVVIGLPGAVLAGGVLVSGRGARVASTGAVRAVLGVIRAVHELVWALLFVNAFGLSPWAGVLAIGIPYGAIVARVVAERLQDVPPEPLDALRAAGASEAGVLLYGRIPAVAADVAGYLLYRFECAVRAAAILSFVGLGGVGYRLDLALADLDFEAVWTVVLALVLTVLAIDAVSARIRTRLLGR